MVGCHQPMFRTRRKLADIMFSKTAIVRMLRAGEADIFRPGEGRLGKWSRQTVR